MSENKIEKSEAEWREQLTPEQFRVTRQKGTEPAFSGEYCHTKTPGIYHCVCCEQPLYRSEAKYDSGSGWPSYNEPYDDEAITTAEDHELGMVRREILCRCCGAHLGHVFDDGPAPTGLRYCVNSAALKLERPDGKP